MTLNRTTCGPIRKIHPPPGMNETDRRQEQLKVTIMAYATEIQNTSRGTSLRERLSAFFADVQESRRKARVYRATLRELQQLSDRELTDLGLARGNLRMVAFEAAYGPTYDI